MTRKTAFTQADTNRQVNSKDHTASLTVKGQASGRLDAYLAAQFAPDLSRSRIKALIEASAVTLNGKIILEAKRKIAEGDEIVITMPEPSDAEPIGEDIPLDVIFEDEHVIVINKPAGLVVHPGAGNTSGTLVNALIHHCGTTLSGIGGVKRPGIVHRLDKDTSGIMIVAKNDMAHRHLAEQFADHGRTGALKRAYKAIIWDGPTTLKGTINASLGRSTDRLKRAVKPDNTGDAKHAVTHYTVLKSYGETQNNTRIAALVECRLETGRTHQIRVHMAHIGYPLIGDMVYGAAFKTKANKLPEHIRETVIAFPRQALHAYLLQFEHPNTGEIMAFEAPLPPDMQHLTAALERV